MHAEEKNGLLTAQGSDATTDYDDDASLSKRRPQRWIPSHASTILSVAVILSLVLNGILLTRQSQHQSETPVPADRETTRYAGLQYTSEGTWTEENVYTQENLTAADEAWLNLNIDHAFVALTKEHSADLGLPPSLRFPWDATKQLYLLSSVHSIHCLQILHRSHLEFRINHTQTYTTEHVLHCLDNLRADLMCSADDTPRYVPVHATESTAKTGVGQVRQCRDWDQLTSWAKNHSACFNYNEFERKELEEVKTWPSAWSYCGKDSQYLQQVQKFYRKGAGWVPEDKGRPDIDEIRGKGHG